jgi:phage anti-repressor protein
MAEPVGVFYPGEELHCVWWHSKFIFKKLFMVVFSAYSFIQYQYFIIFLTYHTLNQSSISTIILILLYFQ